MGSGERKRCSNMAPVRRLRSLAWMKARKLPGVRCSTLNTECRSLLCLMIMPGRNWVAGIDIAQNSPCTIAVEAGGRRASHKFHRYRGQRIILHVGAGERETGERATSTLEIRGPPADCRELALSSA